MTRFTRTGLLLFSLAAIALIWPLHANGEPAEGIAGPVQLAFASPAAPAWRDRPGPAKPSALVLAQAEDLNETARVQKALTDLGYEPGPIDGDFGPTTARAIAAYERDNGLEETGQISPELLARLEGRPVEAADGESEAETAAAEAAPLPDPVMPEITDDPSSYDLGDLSDLNTFD